MIKRKRANNDLEKTTENKKSNTNHLVNRLIVAYDTKTGRRGRDRMAVRITTTYAISAYHY